MDHAQNRRVTIAATAILAVAVALRFVSLAGKNIWLDEAASWSIVGESWPEFWRVVINDIHPPLYYLLLKGWVGLFGPSEVGLRSLSVAAGIATVWFGWRLAGRWLAPSVALAAMGWLAVSPHLLFFAQEARMYALATAIVLGGSLAYCRWLESGGRRTGALAAFAFSAAAALYVHYFTALWLAAVWVHFLSIQRSRSATSSGVSPIRAWLIAHVAIAMLYTPWAPSAWAQLRRGQPWRADVTLGDLPWYASEMFRQFLLGYSGDLRWRMVTGALLVLVIALVGFGCFLLHRSTRQREGAQFLLAVTLVPVVLGLLAVLSKGDMHLSRYLPYTVPFLCIAIARGWAGILGNSPRAAIPVAMGALALLPFAVGYFADPHRDSDVRPILRYLDRTGAGTNGHDRVVVMPGFMAFSYRFYDAVRPLERVSSEDEWRAFEASASVTTPTWIILDYRWPEFERLSNDPRFEVVAVPGGQPKKLRLLRMK